MQKIFFKEVDSTMDEARKEAKFLDSNSHLMIIADKQLNGRGQKGKRWDSQSGGIYFTIASSFDQSFSLSGYSLFIGLLLSKSLSDFNINTKLKWPNDIFDHLGRKLAGVLIETYKNGERQVLLTGIGINLSNLPELEISASSISNLTDKSISRLDILTSFEKHFEKEIDNFLRKSFSEYYLFWNKLDFFKNKKITFDNGQDRFSGKSKGVDNQGRFLLESKDQTLSFVSGNIII